MQLQPPPIDVELLNRIALQNEYAYVDAYAVWLECYTHPDVYTLIDTVLWIAQAQKLPVTTALKLVEGIEEQFSK